MKIFYDVDVWEKTHPDDLWIFDKLILSKKLGYVCGPKGINVPKDAKYIIRPCINLLGMGRGAFFKRIKKYTEKTVPDGFFWCEAFEGRHLSIDYFKKQQVLCVEGIGNKKDPKKWSKWIKTNDRKKYPKILKTLKGKYDYVNVEYIGNKIIEIHLRHNPDFFEIESEEIIPVWKGSLESKTQKKKGYVFIKDEDYTRVGFFIKEEK